MWEWLKRLLKKKPVVVKIKDVVEVKINAYYNIRDKKGRFCKKGD